jgi:hypothetical protein
MLHAYARAGPLHANVCPCGFGFGGQEFGHRAENEYKRPEESDAGGGTGMSETESKADAELGEEELNRVVRQLCETKAEEFHLLGYDQVSGPDVWECVSDKYHKKGMPPLHAIVNDILSLRVTQFMNFITLNLYRGERR